LFLSIEQMAFGVVDLLQVALVADGGDTGLAGDALIVTGENRDAPDLQAFG